MSDKRMFHLGALLSVTTGCLVAPDGIGGVYEILDWMTGDSLFTHQLPRAADECAPYLRRQYPQLASVDASGVTGENWRGWLDNQCALLGDTFALEPLPKHAHEFIDPISEAAEHFRPEQMIIVDHR